MSYVITAAGKVHQKQLDAANKTQDVLVGAVEKLRDLSAKAPKAPKAPEALKGLTEPLEKVTGPIHTMVGTNREFAAFFTTSTRDLLAAQGRFQNRILDVVAGSTVAPVKRPASRAAKKA